MARRAEHWFPASGGWPPDPNLRVGDAERGAVADALSQHYSAGRLDDGELKERLDRAMGAKTHADLRGLLADLPPLASQVPDRPQAPPRHRALVVWGAFAVMAFFFLSAPLHAGHWWFWFPGPSWLVLAVVGLWVWRRGRRRAGWSRPGRP